MAYNEQVARICRLQNAWEVEIYSPPEEKKHKKGEMVPYEDPWKSYAFGSSKEALVFLKDKLDKLKPADPDGEYSSAFKEAASKT